MRVSVTTSCSSDVTRLTRCAPEWMPRWLLRASDSFNWLRLSTSSPARVISESSSVTFRRMVVSAGETAAGDGWEAITGAGGASSDSAPAGGRGSAVSSGTEPASSRTEPFFSTSRTRSGGTSTTWPIRSGSSTVA